MFKNNIKFLFLYTVAACSYTINTANNTNTIQADLVVVAALLTEEDHENNINSIVEDVTKAMPEQSSVEDLIAAAILLKHSLLKALDTVPQSLRYQNLQKALHNLNIKSIQGKQLGYNNALTFANQIKYFQEMLKNLPVKSRNLLITKIPIKFKMFIKI